MGRRDVADVGDSFVRLLALEEFGRRRHAPAAANAAAGLPPFTYKTIPQGAATSVWAGVVASSDEVGGRYCEDCHVAQPAEGVEVMAGVRAYALDPDHAKALWAKSEEMVGERF
jgi:hypothetical protein